MPLVHKELRRIAGRHLHHERADHTLQASALVNEAYLRLIEIKQMQWQNRAHFFAMASRIMRRILVEAARAKGRHKRSRRTACVDRRSPHGGCRAVPGCRGFDDALNALEAVDPRKCRVVDAFFRRTER